MRRIKTTCPYCGVGCGLEVEKSDDGKTSVRGDESHPANFGRLCSKGAALATTLDLSGRLLSPVVAGKQTDWSTALDRVSDEFSRAIELHGPDSVAFYVSGQLLTEDYYVANKLMKGFIGSGNIDTNSRLCMSSSVVGHKRAFGSDTVPGCYEDWEQCELIVLTGSNTAWCHPVLFQRLAQAKKDNPNIKVVVIDPRRTATCEIADLHLPIKPGADAYLFNGLLHWLYNNGYQDSEFVDNHTQGLAPALDVAGWHILSLESIADSCGLDVESVKTFYEWFGQTEKTVTVYSQGINQSSSGSDKVNAIINCHLLTARIGKPGMGPFSVTGQPNAMGGREVGALSNQLAAHMSYENPEDVDRVARFWSASRMSTSSGLKAVDLFEAIHEGKIKALWVMATNPAVSMPQAGFVQEALERCEFVVVSDCVERTDTTAYADVLLPALAWGEKAGTVTNSERRISRQRPFLDSPGDARSDWWILSQVARHMGFEGFDYQGPSEIFREHARLSAFENEGHRDFDLSGLVDISDDRYESFMPTQWPVLGDASNSQRLFDSGKFFSSSGKARFVAVDPQPPAAKIDKEYPFVLNTGRVRDQWHTMTRTGKSPRLNEHTAEPYAQVHPDDATSLGVTQGQLVKVDSQFGSVVAQCEITEAQRPGSVFVPMHWSHQNSSAGSVGPVVNACCDRYSGQPEFKHTPVNIEPWAAQWHGFLLTRQPIELEHDGYWVRSWREGFWRYEISGTAGIEDWATYTHRIFSPIGDSETWSELLDSTARNYRAARFYQGRLDSCIFISDRDPLPSAEWIMSLFALEEIPRAERLRILSARPASPTNDEGKVVCSCFGVGEKRICQSIEKFGLEDVEQVGARLQAGTNCGSCIPEINTLIQSVRQ